jgi:hypothetical protein
LTKQQTERQDAIARLRDWIKPGDTVYTILDHVSASGMSRAIRVVLPTIAGATLESAVPGSQSTDYIRRDSLSIEFLHPNWAVGKALGLRHWKRDGREQDALVVGGGGMDMGFHLVNSLSYALYGDGYQCLGKGRCPSNYHVNHRLSTDGPESFDLRHTDGYALRHRWL